MPTRSYLREPLGYAPRSADFLTSAALPGVKSGLPNTRGLRRQTLETFATQGEAEGFAGLPEDFPNYRRVHDIAAKALRLLGVSEPALSLLGYLFNWTQPQDWQKGSRPIAFPSNDTVCDDHGLSEASLRRYVMELREAGAITMKDSGNNKRYGRRDPQGRIILASTFGYDLSPLAIHHNHYQDIVKAHKSACALRKDARRTIKIAARALQQMIESAEDWNLVSAYWTVLPQRIDALAQQFEQAASTAALTDVAHRFELLRADALAVFTRTSSERAERMKAAGASCAQSSKSAVDIDGIGETMSGRPLNPERLYNTTAVPLDSVFVQASRQVVVGCSSTSVHSTNEVGDSEPDFREHEAWTGIAPWDGGEVKSQEVKTSPQELADLVPEIGDRIVATGQDVNWGSLTVATAAFARDYGINSATVRKAVRVIGWQSTHISLVVVASKSRAHFDVSPGAYFTSLIGKAERGELDLRRSLWGLRQAAPDIAASHKPAKIHCEKTPIAVPKPLPAMTEAAEIRAEREKANASRRDGPPVQPLGSALAGMVAVPAVKRGLATVIKDACPASTPLPVGFESDLAAIQSSVEELAARRKQAQDAKLAAMTPSQRARHDEQERIRLAICAQHRRQTLRR
jgi:replication initiation protein RepC